MGLPESEGRLGFVARHIVAQDEGRPLPEAPSKRTGKLTDEQAEEVKRLLAAVHRAVNASNCKIGSPLRNVAEHLFSQHRSASGPKPPPMSSDERARAARVFAMNGAAPKAVSQQFDLPAAPTAEEMAKHEAALKEEEDNDPLVMEAKEAALRTFEKVDKENTGEIGKEHLFAVIRALGQLPGTSKEEQEAYLNKEFAKADADGSGTVDFQEFVQFYIDLVCQTEAEEQARIAFAKYDVDGGGELEKHELFQVRFIHAAHAAPSPRAQPLRLLPVRTRAHLLASYPAVPRAPLRPQVMLDLDVVVGDTKAEKEAFLDREFSEADADGGGTVDFEEFVQFFTKAKKKARSAGMKHEKAMAMARREQRKMASGGFTAVEALMGVMRTGDVRLLSAQWVLRRAGFDSQVVERQGRKLTKWSAGKGAGEPLLPRQLLEKQCPEAFLDTAQLDRLVDSFRSVVSATKGAEKDRIAAAPVVVISHCWEEKESPDPAGTTLQAFAAELGRQMPAYAAWGFDDVGVFFDWSSCFQDTVDVVRTAQQTASFERAVEAMPMLYAHRQSTVFLVADQKVEPPRASRGWPFYEECLTKLFKEAPPPKRYRLPEAGPTHLWPKVVRIGEDVAEAQLGGYKAQGPPVAPTNFMQAMATKVFSRQADRDVVLTDYRKTIEHGFSGLDKLLLSRRGWNDDDLEQFAITIKEVECPMVTEVDLSANDMTAKGLDAFGNAVANGALHSLTSLSLSDCSGLLNLPDTLAQLHMLQVLKLDGCIGLTTFPNTFNQMAALKAVHLTHCLKLLNNTEALSMLPQTVQIIKEKKEKEKEERRKSKEERRKISETSKE